jgi:hypothetical protein
VLEGLSQTGFMTGIEGAKLVDLEKWKLGKAAVSRKKGALVPFVSRLYSIYHIENGRRDVYLFDS